MNVSCHLLDDRTVLYFHVTDTALIEKLASLHFARVVYMLNI